jgi:hypothetical protein
MAKRRRPPSQGWRTFLRNHADGIASMDLFVVSTISFRLLSFPKISSGGDSRREAESPHHPVTGRNHLISLASTSCPSQTQ